MSNVLIEIQRLHYGFVVKLNECKVKNPTDTTFIRLNQVEQIRIEFSSNCQFTPSADIQFPCLFFCFALSLDLFTYNHLSYMCLAVEKEMEKRLDRLRPLKTETKEEKNTQITTSQTNNNERLIVIYFDESKRNLNITWSSKSFCVVVAAAVVAAAAVRCNVKALNCATAAFNWNALSVLFFSSNNLCGAQKNYQSRKRGTKSV